MFRSQNETTGGTFTERNIINETVTLPLFVDDRFKYESRATLAARARFIRISLGRSHCLACCLVVRLIL